MSNKILIIEDEVTIAELEKDYLELSGFSVVARLGFEPRQTESESAVLPLHNRALCY